MPFQVNCSELIADFKIHDDEQMRRVLKLLVREYGIRVYLFIDTQCYGEYPKNFPRFSAAAAPSFNLEGINFVIEPDGREFSQGWKISPVSEDDNLKFIETICKEESAYWKHNYDETYPEASCRIFSPLIESFLRAFPQDKLKLYRQENEGLKAAELFEVDIKLIDPSTPYVLTTLEYGDNGYDEELGWRFDSGCNHVDGSNYPFFAWAEQHCQAEVRSYDGGSTIYYDEFVEEEGHYRLEKGESH